MSFENIEEAPKGIFELRNHSVIQKTLVQPAPPFFYYFLNRFISLWDGETINHPS